MIAINGQRQHVHFVGIGGAGLSALAFVMLAKGWKVSGSDRQPSERLDALRAAGATVEIGHSAAFIDDADMLVVSSAIPDDNPEVVAAQEQEIPVYKRNRFLAELTRGYDLIAVAGTHGKTTTSAILTTALAEAGIDPTAVIGGEVPQLGGNARVGGSRFFILEADEYDYTFLGMQPFIAIITNVEHDHPDMFPDEVAVREAFERFAAQVRPDGTLIVCGDDPGVQALIDSLPEPHARVVTYGFGDDNEWHAAAVQPNEKGGMNFVAVHDGEPMGAFGLRVPGRHNVENALAAIIAAHQLGLSMSDLQMPIQSFTGASRRFEPIGSVGRVQIFDDYAHHPSEVRATLNAARQRFGERPIWVVFQPHTYSRLAALLHDFATAFAEADRVYVSDVYAARETNDFNLSGADLAERIDEPETIYTPTHDDILQRLLSDLPKDVVVLTLGAGDITSVGPRLRRALEERSNEH